MTASALKRPSEVAGSGGVGEQLGVQGIQVTEVPASPLQILQPRAAADHVVGEVQHVVRLVVGQMHLQQVQPGVDLRGQPQRRRRAMFIRLCYYKTTVYLPRSYSSLYSPLSQIKSR